MVFVEVLTPILKFVRHRNSALTTTVLAFALFSPQIAIAEQIRVIAFNVEGGYKADAELETIANVVKHFSPADLWGFSEVTKEVWPERLTEATGPSRKFVLGTTSDNRLLAVYDSRKFTLIRHYELSHLQFTDNGRAPLILHLRLDATGTEFLFTVNHFHRRGKDKRNQQARGLNIWASEQTLPIIAVGDFNFDWNIPPTLPYRDRGYDLMITDDAFAWVRPDVLIKTQCSKKYNSILDFAFVANDAKNWPRESRVLLAEDDCIDNEKTSDHRPIELTIDIP